MCLSGGGDYDCIKLLMILKMLKCFGHSVQKQWLSPWQQECIYLFPWQWTRGVLKEGFCRAHQRRLPALRCSSLEQRLWAHSGALILQLTGANWNSVVLFLLPV